MSYTPEELLTLAEKFEQIVATAKDKKKLDPKAKVRNRGTVCVPASSAKDKKDHFPINSESQARNALARVHQYSSVPSWYSGSLKSLQELVSRKVHSKYKGIGKSEKKKSSMEVVENFMAKYGQDQNSFYQIVKQYDQNAPCVLDFAQALKISADTFSKENNLDDPNTQRVYHLLLKQAQVVEDTVPEIEALDQQIDQGDHSEGEVSSDEIEGAPGGEPNAGNTASSVNLLVRKYS
jgi:hypothetical protein